MYFNHFAIHHTSPAKLHTAFWIASSAVSVLGKADFQKFHAKKSETNETRDNRDKCIQLIETKAEPVAAENVVAIIFVVLHDRLKTSGTKFVAKPRLDLLGGMTRSDEV